MGFFCLASYIYNVGATFAHDLCIDSLGIIISHETHLVIV